MLEGKETEFKQENKPFFFISAWLNTYILLKFTQWENTYVLTLIFIKIIYV